MKIEMGESLFYSWLRHVKECLLVQNNWKVSPSWGLKGQSELDRMLTELKHDFENNYGHILFQASDLNQILKQGESDAIGISMQNGKSMHYAIDVAFHGKGLSYGSKEKTACKVIEKCIRNAFCLYGFFEAEEAEIIFAAPKIGRALLYLLIPAVDYLNTYFQNAGLKYTFRLIYGDAFFTEVIDPIRIVSEDVEDTAELFMRAYKLLDMFKQQSGQPGKTAAKGRGKKGKRSASIASASQNSAVAIPCATAYDALKVGQIARTMLKRMLGSGLVPEAELEAMQSSADSKTIFGLNYPLLSKTGGKHYYAAPIQINGEKY